MSEKSVVVGVSVHFKGESYFSFEFFGDTSDEDAMKEAAWEALNSENTLAPVEVNGHKYVDDYSTNQAMEVWVEKGTADDYRKLPNPPTKAQLWRRVARLAGELLFYAESCVGPYTTPRFGLLEPEPNDPDILSGIGSVKRLLSRAKTRLTGSYPNQNAPKILKKLEDALAAWEAAT